MNRFLLQIIPMIRHQGLLFLLMLISASLSFGQTAPYDKYQQQYRNTIGVADTITEKILMQRQAIRAGFEAQALESAIDPTRYRLGPGDQLYLNIFSSFPVDLDITITPEGRIIIPRSGQFSVAGMTIAEAEKKTAEFLRKDYKQPEVSLSLRKLRSIKVSVTGDVLAPGVYTGTSVSRVNEMIDKAGGFLKKSSMRNIEVRNSTGTLIHKADIIKFLVTGDQSSNPMVDGGDIIVVPRVSQYVSIYGSVRDPGSKEFVEGDRLSTLINIARGVNPDALLDSVEIARFRNDDIGIADRFYVNYAGGEDPVLHEGDVISIRGRSEYHLPRLVTVSGEIRYPGKYSIELGKTRLLDILQRSGGILETGSLDEAVVLRRVGIGSWESEPEFVMLQQISDKPTALMTEDQLNYYQARMRQLGRSIMVVDFKKLLYDNDMTQNIIMRDDDSVWIPRDRGFVSVIGSVNNQGNVSFIEGMNYRYYIEKAGGFTAKADKSATRVINSRTSTYIDPRSDSHYEIGPGDTIVVPAEKNTFWKDLQDITALTAQIVTIIAGVALLKR